MFGKTRNLVTTQPSLIQRCTLGRDDNKLYYEYMGSSQFELGDQSKSLRRMFEGEIEIYQCSVLRAFGRERLFYLVARQDFPFSAYISVLQGLVNREWKTQEPTYLDDVFKKEAGLLDTDIETQAWFDFTNDVFFTRHHRDAESLVSALDNTKEIWRKKDMWLNTTRVKKFREELEKIKVLLRKNGKEWFSLDSIEDVDGELKVWLNPARDYNSHWCTLQDLRDWLKNKGPIMKKRSADSCD